MFQLQTNRWLIATAHRQARISDGQFNHIGPETHADYTRIYDWRSPPPALLAPQCSGTWPGCRPHHVFIINLIGADSVLLVFPLTQKYTQDKIPKEIYFAAVENRKILLAKDALIFASYSLSPAVNSKRSKQYITAITSAFQFPTSRSLLRAFSTLKSVYYNRHDEPSRLSHIRRYTCELLTQFLR